jgi:hypothetical protein
MFWPSLFQLRALQTILHTISPFLTFSDKTARRRGQRKTREALKMLSAAPLFESQLIAMESRSIEISTSVPS